MSGFAFSDRTLEELERVQGAGGAGRGKVDRRGQRQMGQALASMMRAPHELAFAGLGRRSDAVAHRASLSASARSAEALQRLERTARRAPQVVVKITSRIHGAPSTLGAFTYAGRLGMSDKEAIGIETSEGKHLLSAHDMLLLAREWQQWEQSDEARRKGATAIAMVFSMPPGTDPVAVRAAVQDFAENDMANRRWVMALHTDEAHPHVHLIISGRDNDGRRFNPNREFLQHCRKRFAENLRALGIEADATPRMARGYPPKQDPAPVLKMRERGALPEVDMARVAMIKGGSTDADERLAARESDRKSTAENASAVREVYQRAITELEAHGGATEAGRARALRVVVENIPSPADGRTEIIERLKAGDALPREFEKDPELELLKTRVSRRTAEQQAAALEQIQQATAKIRTASAELKGDAGKGGKGDGESTAFDRIRARSDDLRKGIGQHGAPPLDAAAARLIEAAKEMRRKVEQADRGRDRERTPERDRDKEGPS